MMYTDIAEHAKYLQNIPNCSKVHLNALKEEVCTNLKFYITLHIVKKY